MACMWRCGSSRTRKGPRNVPRAFAASGLRQPWHIAGSFRRTHGISADQPHPRARAACDRGTASRGLPARGAARPLTEPGTARRCYRQALTGQGLGGPDPRPSLTIALYSGHTRSAQLAVSPRSVGFPASTAAPVTGRMRMPGPSRRCGRWLRGQLSGAPASLAGACLPARSSVPRSYARASCRLPNG
jgi:hypothetical protein